LFDRDADVTRPAARIVLGLLLALGADGAYCARLGDNTVKLLPSKLRLMQNIGPLRYSGTNRYSDRRLGRSFSYGVSGISLTIYVYDYGLSHIPDGPDSVHACEQFERARREIEEGENYQNVVLRGQSTRRMTLGADTPLVREAHYELDRNGIHAVSMLWLTAADGYFVKLRLSLRGEVADELEDARQQILGELAAAIAMRPARRANAGAAPQPDTGIEIDPGNDPAEAQLWVVYATELLKAARESPGAMPACGGPLLPTCATELTARGAALREYLARDSRPAGYFAELASVEAGGLLEEYVWHYLRSAKDKSPPAELDLAAFELFRQRELAAHVVRTGARVRVNAVQALPLNPAP
jgi:hypothetical protein